MYVKLKETWEIRCLTPSKIQVRDYHIFSL